MNLQELIYDLEEEFDFDDDKVLYSLISEGYSYEELIEYFSSNHIERVSGMVMRNEEV